MAATVVAVWIDGVLQQQLNGRAAAMALWLSVYADQINKTHRGTITIDWEGTSMRPQLAAKFDRINTDSLLPASDQAAS